MTTKENIPTEIGRKTPAEWKLKGVKAIRGHDGNGFEATIYWEKKKIGHVFDDGWGGPLQYTWDIGTDDQWRNLAKKYDDSEYGGIDILIGDLISEYETMKAARAAMKRSKTMRAILIRTEGYDVDWMDERQFAAEYVFGMRDDAEKKLDQFLAKNNAEQFRIITAAEAKA